MYIKDGTNKDYCGDQRCAGMPLFKNVYAFGWLKKKIPNKSWPSQSLKENVIQKLKSMEKTHGLDFCMGIQLCGFCQRDGKSFGESHGFNGSMKIAHNHKTYICPLGTSHYIDAHDYYPGQEVVTAILNGHYYTRDDLKKIGISQDDVIELMEKEELRMKKIKEDRIADNKAFIEARKKLYADPNWQKTLQKSLMEGMGFKD